MKLFKQTPELHVTVSNKTIVRVIAFLIGTLLLIQFILNVLHPLTLIFVALFLALALNPAVSWFIRRLKMKSRAGATAIAYGIVLSILIGFFMLVVPPLVNQTVEFVRELPSTLESLESQDSALGQFIRRYELGEQLSTFATDLSSNVSDVQGPVLSAANRVVSNLLSIITVFILTFMMLVEGPRWLGWLWRTLPEKKSKHVQSLAAKMYRAVTGYVNGQVIVAFISGFSSLFAILIASAVLDVSVNALALAAIVTLFALVPTIGNIISAVVVTLFCLFSSTALAIVVLVYFIVYQQIENATIQPYIQSRSNELTALTVFIAALLGIGFGGILGGLVAIPIASCAKILLEDWLDNHQFNASK